MSAFNRDQPHYIDRLHEFMDAELHPETAQHIGELAIMTLGNAELIMSVILQMQLDHVRKDIDLQKQAESLDGAVVRYVV